MTDEIREFRLPDLGEGLTEAEIVQWLVKPGDTIELNQPICEVETEKAIVEIPSPFAGVVDAVFGDVGQKVAVGAPLLKVRTSGDAPHAGRKEVLVGYGPEEGGGKRRKDRKIGRRSPPSDSSEREVEMEGGGQERLSSRPGPRAGLLPPLTPDAMPRSSFATPPVRKLARDLGVDIDAVRGSGPDGRVTREDVQAAGRGSVPALENSALEPSTRRASPRVASDEERIPVRAIRRSIAERMVRSAFTIPHVTEWLQIDATELMRLRADLSSAPEANGRKISPLPIVVKALLAAIRAHPLINSSWDDEHGEIVVKHRYHVGIATDTERGLLVPVMKDADQLNVFELVNEIARLAAAARQGKIGPADLTGSTITVTNVGSFGMDSGTPIINYPEAAILAPGKIAKRPWVVNGEIVVRDVMTLAMSLDHRIVDGAEAGRFLRYLGDLIEKPARLFGVL